MERDHASTSPPRLQRCKSFCMAVFIAVAALPPSRLQPPPPSRPSRAGCPSPAIGSIRALRAGLRPAGCRQGCASRWRAGVAGDGLQGAGRPRCSRAGRSPGGQHEAGGQTRARAPREGDKGARGATRAVKRSFEFPSMLPLLSSPLGYFSPLPFLGAVFHGLDRSGGFLWRWDLASPTTFSPCGFNTRHPMLSASFDESWKACGRRPHLYDGLLGRPGNATGRLHQHQGRSLMQHRKTAYASLSAAPSGKTPVSRKRHSAMSN